jgi:hypothetical protein
MTILHVIIFVSSLVSKVVLVVTVFAGWKLGKRLVNMSRLERGVRAGMIH